MDKDYEVNAFTQQQIHRIARRHGRRFPSEAHTPTIIGGWKGLPNR